MLLKLYEIKEIEKGLGSIINKEIDIKTAFKLSRLLMNISKESQNIEENRVKLVKKYGEPDTNDENAISVPKEKMNEFQKELIDLFNEEINIEFEPIDISKFSDIKMTIQEMNQLQKIIVENEVK